MNLVFLGPPGAGKSVQAKFVARELGLPVLSMGDVVRRQSRSGGWGGERLKQIMEHGDLVDEGVFSSLLSNELEKVEYRRGVVVDGAPRTVPQAKLVDKSIGVDRVFYIKVSDKVVQDRLLSRGRVDDSPSVIRRRMKIYHQKTEPVIKYYKEQGVLREVDGSKSREEVSRAIAGFLKGLKN